MSNLDKRIEHARMILEAEAHAYAQAIYTDTTDYGPSNVAVLGAAKRLGDLLIERARPLSRGTRK